MKTPKTVKYFINTYLSECTVNNEMEVSKTVYYKQLKSVLEQYNNQEFDSEFTVDMDIYKIDHETYTEERQCFTYSICAVDFVTLVCKDNYHFTK